MPQFTKYAMVMPPVIAICWYAPSWPRTALGANSPTYIGAIIDAMPTATPPSMR